METVLRGCFVLQTLAEIRLALSAMETADIALDDVERFIPAEIRLALSAMETVGVVRGLGWLAIRRIRLALSAMETLDYSRTCRPSEVSAPGGDQTRAERDGN
jgi:hypothetical protein